METPATEHVFKLHWNLLFNGCAFCSCCSKATLPWPASDPPLCTCWVKSDAQPFLLTRHFSGWGEWTPAHEALVGMYCQSHTKKVARKMATAMLPVVRAYLGLPAESQLLNTYRVNPCLSPTLCFC